MSQLSHGLPASLRPSGNAQIGANSGVTQGWGGSSHLFSNCLFLHEGLEFLLVRACGAQPLISGTGSFN